MSEIFAKLNELAALTGPWQPLVLVFGAIALGLLVHAVVFAVLHRVAARTGTDADDLLVGHTRSPARIIVPLIALLIALPGADLEERLAGPLHHGVVVGLTIGLTWLAVAAINFTAALAERRLDITQADNLNARRMLTQVRVMRKVGMVIAVILGAGAVLMTFPTLRNVGVSLFASAGIAGLVVGLAARPILSNLLAGLQIALTDPIRIDDVVIVEGEWGWIEEINTTYVVVRIWDLRRLIVPLTNFIEKPFENWTRRSADILGTVFLYTDYSAPFDEIRAELQRIVEASDHWDGKVCGLQVTNASERTVELRALMSAANSPAAWNLRCEVRERLIAFLQSNYPDSLPRLRADLSGEGREPAPDEAAAA